jgi:tRNA A37 threonylcarbamoyladenosine dehydratase
MERERFTRTKMVIGQEGLDQLHNAHVAVFGIGGVGSFTVEALARAGVGKITLIDFDVIVMTNINRQIHALEDTIGQAKVEAMKARILKINPEMEVVALQMLYNDETCESIFSGGFDYVVDAIDLITWKMHLIEHCTKNNIPIMSSMGTGNKMDPTQFKVADLYETSFCPLAKILRHELRQRGVNKLKVVYSTEVPCKPDPLDYNPDNLRKLTPGSISFVPSVAGLIIASEVVKDLIGR